MSKRKPLLFISVLFVTALGIITSFFFLRIPYVTLKYIESDRILTNPSRGFYVQFDTAHLRGLESLSDEGVTLIFLAYDLKDFVDREISIDKLNELSMAFKSAQRYGLKVIFRAAYGFNDAQDYSDPTSISIIKGHLKQIAPILNLYKSSLLSVQAGFLGTWGEWHDSNLGDAQGTPEPKIINELLVALCEAVPKPITIAVRRPRFIRDIDPNLVDLSRIAFHNDALLSTDSDMGTYDDASYSRENELNYISSLPYVLANGGEMSSVSVYTQAEVALKELSQLKVTYLNKKYNIDVLDLWEKTPYLSSNFFDTISKKLGYRWFINSIRLPSQYREGQTITLKITIENTGFSAVVLPYTMELIVSDSTGILQILSFKEADLQALLHSSEKQFKVSIDTKGLPQSYSLGIRIRETSMTQITDERTLIKLANDDFIVHDGIHDIAFYQKASESKEIIKLIR